jgi:hypothetical protein
MYSTRTDPLLHETTFDPSSPPPHCEGLGLNDDFDLGYFDSIVRSQWPLNWSEQFTA